MSEQTKYRKLVSNTATVAVGTLGSKLLVYLLVRLYTTVLTGEEFSIASNITELATLLKADGIHLALDTSCSVMNDDVKKLIDKCDLVIADLKFTSEEEYGRYTGGSLATTVDFLDYLRSVGKEVWIRQVILPGINDREENVRRLKELISPYSNISRVELLPFRKLCLEKYQGMGIPFPLSDTEEMGSAALGKLQAVLDE